MQQTNTQHAAGNIFASCLADLESKSRILETCGRVCCIKMWFEITIVECI